MNPKQKQTQHERLTGAQHERLINARQLKGELMVHTVYDPNTGKIWYYELAQRKYNRDELKALAKAIKKKLKEKE